MQSQKYKSARAEAEKLYASFGKEKCPALHGEFVYFTSEGFNHLVYQTKKKPRDERVQITKFNLLSKAKQLLAISTTYQEYEEDIKPIKMMRHKKFGTRAL